MCFGIFALMLTLNILTPYICDDFTYRLNFLTREPLGSFWEIFPSMYAHSYKMNGRLISHGLAQVFMLLPPIIFDIVNAAVFTGTVYLVHRLCARKRSPLLLASVFCLFWLFTPAFGQVVLWQVGAVNYFWALTGCMLFFTPELLRFRDAQKAFSRNWHRAAFCVYSFFFGWFNEIASFVGICMVICLILLDGLVNRKGLRLSRFLPAVCAAAGYIVMLMMPAQSAKKQDAELTLTLLLQKAENCTRMLLEYFTPLLVIFAALFLLGLIRKLPVKTLILSGLFALAGICANYMPIVASYYPERCMCTTTLMLIMAVSFLAAALGRGKGLPLLASGCALLMVLTLPSGLRGCRDIVGCYAQHRQREEHIAAALEQGERDVVANIVLPTTPYSGFWGLADLNPDDSTTWPNHSMALYYGLDSLLGE